MLYLQVFVYDAFLKLIHTFSIFDLSNFGSGNGSLKKGAELNPPPQRNAFLKRKDNDFLPILFAVLCNRISDSLLGTTLIDCWRLLSLFSESPFIDLSEVLLCSKLGKQSMCFSDLRLSFGWSWQDDKLCWRLEFSGSFRALFPNVPIESNPFGQSLNSSLQVWCMIWSGK